MKREQIDEISIEKIKTKTQNIVIPDNMSSDLSVDIMMDKINENLRAHKARKRKVILRNSVIAASIVIAAGLIFVMTPGLRLFSISGKSEPQTNEPVTKDPNKEPETEPMPEPSVLLGSKDLPPPTTDYSQLYGEIKSRMSKTDEAYYGHINTFKEWDYSGNDNTIGMPPIGREARINSSLMDGGYIYLMETYKLRIIDVRGEIPVEASVIDFNIDEETTFFTFHDFYVYENKLIVIYYKHTWNYDSEEEYMKDGYEGEEFKDEDEELIDDEELWDEEEYRVLLTIAMYDLSDKKNPVIEREYMQEGEYESSLLTDEGILCVISSCMPMIIKDSVEDCVPVIDNENMNIDDICILDDLGTTYTVIVTLDTKSELKKIDNKAYLGQFKNIYLTPESIYCSLEGPEDITKTDLEDIHINIKSGWRFTQIVRLSFTDGIISVVGNTYIRGQLINQCLLEDGHLAVIFYHRTIEKKSPYNGMYILDKQLNVVGSFEKIQEGENNVRVALDYGEMFFFKHTEHHGYLINGEGLLFGIDYTDFSNIIKSKRIELPEIRHHDFYMLSLYMLSQDLLVSAFKKESTYYITIFDISDPLNSKAVDELRFDGSPDDYYDYEFYDKKLSIDRRNGTFGFNIRESIIENDYNLEDVFSYQSPNYYNSIKSYLMFSYTDDEGIQIKKRLEILNLDYGSMDWHRCLEAFIDSKENITEEEISYLSSYLNKWIENNNGYGEFVYFEDIDEKYMELLYAFNHYVNSTWEESPHRMRYDIMYSEDSEVVCLDDKMFIITKNKGIIVLDRDTLSVRSEMEFILKTGGTERRNPLLIKF